MKIIERGVIPAEREWKFLCVNCRTRFECQENEGEYITDQRDGDTVRVECPVCNRDCYGSRKS
jgi:hypothetical protein